jgi:hypothetical protein
MENDMTKNLILAVITVMLSTSSLALANGIRGDDGVAKKIAGALSHKTVVCSSGNDRVELTVNSSGDLRITAHIAGSISGDLDTDNEEGGEECGGLTATLNAKYSDFVLDDTYNDCERGDWGYRLMFSETELSHLDSTSAHFTAHGISRLQDSDDGKTESYQCLVK